MSRLSSTKAIDNHQFYELVNGFIAIHDTYDGYNHPDALKSYIKSQAARGVYAPVSRAFGGTRSEAFNQVLNAYIASLPSENATVDYTPSSARCTAEPDAEPEARTRYRPVEVNCHRCCHRHCRCDTGMDSFFFWWLLLRPSTVEHHHYHHNSKSDNKSDPLLAFIIFMSVLAMIASSVIATIYLYGQLDDIITRLIYNEGREYAVTSLAWLIVSGLMGFGTAGVVVPLILVATAAANPVAWAIFGMITLGLVFTSLVHTIFPGIVIPALQSQFEDSLGESSFVKKDFDRIQLTDAEQAKLIDKNLDPIKVALAISLLRKEMGDTAVVNRYGLHAFSSETCRSKTVQSNLEQIRHLRAGDLAEAKCPGGVIKVGNMTVDMNGIDQNLDADEDYVMAEACYA